VLKSEIRVYDPDAKVHLKIMPNLWTENARGHGIDMEALTRMSEIIGNDCGAAYAHMWKRLDWQDKYAFEWRELCMSHDFYKSVSPDKIMYNTESHFLSTTSSRELKMDPLYARAVFWMAHTFGLTASQNWFWARNEDGSVSRKAGKGYAASNNQQPRIVNEVHAVMMDLNAYSEEIMAMQRQKKPIRIFYSKASAVNKREHMDDVFELYESLSFEGVPLGFVTSDILKTENPSEWDVVLVYETEFVTEQDLAALQSYINQGGKVILDGISLKKDEYGRPLDGLNGEVVFASTREEMKALAMSEVASRGDMPPVVMSEKNDGSVKGCIWKCIENERGNPVLSIVNVGKTTAALDIQWGRDSGAIAYTDVLTGSKLTAPLRAKPYEVLFVEVTR
jgi:beta-galactosidase